MTEINSNIFNLQKDYKSSYRSLFLGEKKGLLDSINKKNPRVWELYKEMKNLDWDENEFPMTSCISEFEKCPRSLYDIMIMTLAWQWEGDSVAAHNLLPIIAPFISDDGAWNAYSRIGDNENLHALAYSEIVKNSFRDPDDAMNSVLQEAEAIKRLKVVADVFAETQDVGIRILQGTLSRDSDEARDALMLFLIALLGLERIQFMASFAITFAIANTGWFMPIGKTVQKICTDEYTVHVELGKEVLKHELNLPEGKASYYRIKERASEIIAAITESELRWSDYIFSDGRELVGHESEDIKQWVLYSNTDVVNFLDLDSPYEKVTENPLNWITDWININANQPSPQEEKTGNYLLGGIVDTAGSKLYSEDF